MRGNILKYTDASTKYVLNVAFTYHINMSDRDIHNNVKHRMTREIKERKKRRKQY